ncbi:MAG: 3'-5' exonuclease domain-containing protein 2 [Desulfobulbus sp.]|nr:MAG: 3'-5' exonuclease domain-containing protein 2 [Desulfobulbus sp.]
MSKEEINEIPIRKWEGPVEVISSLSEFDRVVGRLRQESVYGFDTETRPAFKKGQKYLPSLLQLATEECVYLFQLKSLGLPEELAGLLADPARTKAGVSLAYDLKELQRLSDFIPAGFVGLGRLSRKKGIKNNGLRGLAAVALGIRISKSAQTSNWAKERLTQAQIRYAATDAWIGRELYLKLQEM